MILAAIVLTGFIIVVPGFILYAIITVMFARGSGALIPFEAFWIGYLAFWCLCLAFSTRYKPKGHYNLERPGSFNPITNHRQKVTRNSLFLATFILAPASIVREFWSDVYRELKRRKSHDG